MNTLINRAAAALRVLEGLECWNVSAGGSAGSSFSLAVGGKVARKKELSNADASDEYRKFEGEHTLLVWCSWRLDGAQDALASSDESPTTIATKLTQALKGRRILKTEVLDEACDALICFEGEHVLRIFCDHVPGDPSCSDNWQLEFGDRIIAVGPGFRISEESK